MKKFYETPDITIIRSMSADIITTSARAPIENGGAQQEYEEGIKWEDLFA